MSLHAGVRAPSPSIFSICAKLNVEIAVIPCSLIKWHEGWKGWEWGRFRRGMILTVFISGGLSQQWGVWVEQVGCLCVRDVIICSTTKVSLAKTLKPRLYSQVRSGKNAQLHSIYLRWSCYLTPTIPLSISVDWRVVCSHTYSFKKGV